MTEAREPEAAEEAEPSFDTGAAAVAAALDEARVDPSLRAHVAGFLDAQRSLVELQKHHLHAQFRQLRLRTAGEALKLFLQGLSVVAVLAVVVVLGLMVRDASRARGLVVEGFHAPPAFAARGYSGEVLGAALTSRLGAVQRFANANSLTNSAEVRAGGAEAVKLEIPETGVSLGEVERYLRRWLGQETSLSGDLTDEGDGQVAVSLNMAGHDPILIKGPASDLDGLMEKAAEAAFAAFDPGNYVLYLEGKNRPDEALAAAKATVGVYSSFADTYSLLANADPDRRRALGHAIIATRQFPDHMVGWMEANADSQQLGHEEAALALARRLVQMRIQDQPPAQRPGYAFVMGLGRDRIDRALGDYARLDKDTVFLQPTIAKHLTLQAEIAARRHAGGEAPRLIDLAAATEDVRPSDLLELRWYDAEGVEDWPAALAAAQALVEAETKARADDTPSQASRYDLQLDTVYRPWLALAQAMTGQAPAAQALIATTPLDCYLCVRVRGRIAAAAGDTRSADHWFSEAVRMGPSLPAAHLEWGQAKLARGDAIGALAELAAAHAKGPNFADPLEAWGEAFLAKGEAEGAVARFAEAEKIAPHWGRLHLKWGEALVKLGKADAARAQFRTAGGLQLSAPDRAELARVSAGR